MKTEKCMENRRWIENQFFISSLRFEALSQPAEDEEVAANTHTPSKPLPPFSVWKILALVFFHPAFSFIDDIVFQSLFIFRSLDPIDVLTLSPSHLISSIVSLLPIISSNRLFVYYHYDNIRWFSLSFTHHPCVWRCLHRRRRRRHTPHSSFSKFFFIFIAIISFEMVMLFKDCK